MFGRLTLPSCKLNHFNMRASASLLNLLLELSNSPCIILYQNIFNSIPNIYIYSKNLLLKFEFDFWLNINTFNINTIVKFGSFCRWEYSLKIFIIYLWRRHERKTHVNFIQTTEYILVHLQRTVNILRLWTQYDQ